MAGGVGPFLPAPRSVGKANLTHINLQWYILSVFGLPALHILIHLFAGELLLILMHEGDEQCSLEGSFPIKKTD